MTDEKKRLYRSRNDRVLAGVCGGLGEYLDVDPVLLRVAWAAMVLIGGFGILLYVLWIFIVPLKAANSGPPPQSRKSGSAGIIAGSILIFLGLVFLADEWSWIDLHWWSNWSWRFVGPALLMGAGVWFLVRSSDRRDGSPDSSHTGSEHSSESLPPKGNRFVRSRTDRKVFGVCAGIGRYAGIDPTIVRLLAVCLALFNPPIGVLAYLGLALFTPSESTHEGTVGTPAT